MAGPLEPHEATNAPPPETEGDRLNEDRRHAKRVRARRILLGALLVIVLGLVVYAVWPWLLPPYIYEGPMVQMAGEHDVTLIWYLTRPTDDELSVSVDDNGNQLVFAAEAEGRRYRAVLTDLASGQKYAYTIRRGQHTLAQAALRTNKSAAEPFTFVVFGDSGRGTQEQYRLAAQMNAVDPDLALHTGDVVYGAGERHKYRERFFLPYRELLRRVNLWPSLGNHDVVEPHFGGPYLEVFELPQNGPADEQPERNYWFDYGAARFAIVDSNIDEAALHDHIAPWLHDVMADAAATWKFVVFHHPPYTGGHYAPDQRIQNTLVPVLEDTRVDIVFNGHDHMYQRTRPIRGGEVAEDGDGVVYIVTGAGGARLYEPLPPDERPPYITALNHQIHSFTYVSIEGSELTLKQIALGGAVLDEWTLSKDQATPASP
jgi:hypothetical protein